MNHGKTMLLESKKFVIWGIVAFVAIGFMLVYFGLNSSMILSQFSGTDTITPSNASTRWSASSSNTFRSSLTQENRVRIDGVIVNILARGSALNIVNYTEYLNSVTTGIEQLSTKPVYSGDRDILNIIGYVIYELKDIKSNLWAGNLIMGDFTNIMNTSIAKYESGTGSTQTVATTNTGTTGTTGVVNNWSTSSGTALPACFDGMSCGLRWICTYSNAQWDFQSVSGGNSWIGKRVGGGTIISLSCTGGSTATTSTVNTGSTTTTTNTTNPPTPTSDGSVQPEVWHSYSWVSGTGNAALWNTFAFGVYQGIWPGYVASRDEYESAVDVTIPTEANGKTLVLTAYEKTNWRISNPNHVAITKIFSVGFKTQRVTGDISSIPVEYATEAQYAYDTTDASFSRLVTFLSGKGLVLNPANFRWTYEWFAANIPKSNDYSYYVPSVTSDASSYTAGDKVVFHIDTKGGTNCYIQDTVYYTAGGSNGAGNLLNSQSSQYVKDTSYIKSAGTLGITVRCNYPKTTAVFSREYKVSIRVPSN